MTDYTKTTNFATKDSLPSGNPAKIVKGTEIDTEFNNVATAVATKANNASPTFTGTATFANLKGATGATITTILDEDTMSSDSATAVPTQQSVKAYVDTQLTASDLDFQADTGGALSIDLDSETLTLTGGTGVDTSGSANTVTFAIDSTVATLTGTQTLSNKTIDTASNTITVVEADISDLGTTVVLDSDIGSTVQAYSAVLAGTTASFTTADETKLDGIETSATADQTASEILTALLTVDGTGTGLDADLLDGNHSTAFATAAQGALADSALQSSDIGVNVLAYDSNLQSFVTTFTVPTTDSTAGYVLKTDGAGTLSFVAQSAYDESTVAITGGAINGTTIGATTPSTGSFSSLNVGGSDVVVDTDIGVTVQGYDATIVVDADIGVSVQAYDADTTKNDVANTFTANQTFDNGIIEEYNATGTSGAVTIDLDTGNNFSTAMAGAVTYTFSNPATSGKVSSFTLKVVNDGNAITWPASVDWPSATAPTLSASGATDVFVFYTHDGGTAWYGFTAGQGMA